MCCAEYILLKICIQYMFTDRAPQWLQRVKAILILRSCRIRSCHGGYQVTKLLAFETFWWYNVCVSSGSFRVLGQTL